MYNSNLKPRARRFPLRFPMYYRKSGMSSWQNGDTVNISRTGILFNSEEHLNPEMKLEIRIPFPTQSILTCQGTIVRIEPRISTQTIIGAAVHMNHYRLKSLEKS